MSFPNRRVAVAIWYYFLVMAGTPAGPLEAFLRHLVSSRPWASRLEEVAVRPGREPRLAPLPAWLPDRWREALARREITCLYAHQARALDLLRRGENVVLVTGTASGKSLCFHLPALLACEAGGTALLLYPTKALARDQLASLSALAAAAGLAHRPAAVDGDATPAERETAARAPILVTNPDFLHHRLLPDHRSLGSFLARLRLVALDEAHVYEGLFGHRASGVLRRLRRVCRHHGAKPAFVAASATSAWPAEHAAALVGSPFVAVGGDGSPRGPLRLFLATARAGSARLGRRWGRLALTAELLAAATLAGVRTVAFAPRRREAELILALAGQRLEKAGRAHLLAGYRAGYLPSTRRLLEAGIARGAFTAVVATSALELGVDLGPFALCLLVGLPPSRASLCQRLGRVGRRSQAAAAIAVVEEGEADRARSWLLEAALREGGEVTPGAGSAPPGPLPDPYHPAVCADHLLAAAAELPLRAHELPPPGRKEAARLLAEGLLRASPAGLVPARRQPAAPLRGARSPSLAVRLAGAGGGRSLATVEADREPLELPPGSVHLHLGLPCAVPAAAGGEDGAQGPAREIGTGARPRRPPSPWPVAVASPREVLPFSAAARLRLGPRRLPPLGRGPASLSVQVAAGHLAVRRAGATVLLADGRGRRSGWLSAPGEPSLRVVPGLWVELCFHPGPPLPPAVLRNALVRLAAALPGAAGEVLGLPAAGWRSDAQTPCPRTGCHRLCLLTPDADRAPWLLAEQRHRLAATLAARLPPCACGHHVTIATPCPACVLLGEVVALLDG